MEDDDGKDGGYDCDLVEEPPDDLVCPICLLPPKKPHLISCCGRKLCQTCVSKINEAGQPCPCCRGNEYVIVIDRQVERRVLDLKVYCKYKSKGCTWSGELRDLQKHVESCDMSNIKLIAERQAQRIKELEKRIAIIEKENKSLQKENTKHKHELEQFQLMFDQKIAEKNEIISKILATQEVDKVTFLNVLGTYVPGETVLASYKLSENYEVNNRDWVGLFRVGWSSNRDYYTFEWAPAKDEEGLIRSVKFSGSKLPPDDELFYQFCYVSRSGSIKGASRPFQFFASIRSSTADDLEVNVEDSLLLLRPKNETKVSSAPPPPPTQHLQAKQPYNKVDINERTCPMCGLVFPARTSQDILEQHVNSHFRN